MSQDELCVKLTRGSMIDGLIFIFLLALLPIVYTLQSIGIFVRRMFDKIRGIK